MTSIFRGLLLTGYSRFSFAQENPKLRPNLPHRWPIEAYNGPLYFPGQLLTKSRFRDDQRFFMEKLKLHNRHLVGSVVCVCGLAVRCGKCDGTITVEPGYAIDCCGNDIRACAMRPNLLISGISGSLPSGR